MDSHDFIPGSAHAIVFYHLFTVECDYYACSCGVLLRHHGHCGICSIKIAVYYPCIWIEYERVCIRVCDRWGRLSGIMSLLSGDVCGCSMTRTVVYIACKGCVEVDYGLVLANARTHSGVIDIGR